jgi:hypothetical protein
MEKDLKSIRHFRRRLAIILTIKYTLSFATLWFFAWGSVSLILRAWAGTSRQFLAWGAVGILFAILASVIKTRKYLPSHSSVRALLDHQNQCGGLLMAAGNIELGDWQTRIPAIKLPVVRWRSTASLVLSAASILFLTLSLVVPVRFAALGADRSLDVNRETGELAEKIEILKDEEIIKQDQAAALEQKLDQLSQKAEGEDPLKTWEALDHLSDAVGKTAKEAAESISARQEKLTQAEALAEGLLAGHDQLDAQLLTEAMQTLSSMMKDAIEKNQMLNSSLSSEMKEAIKSGALKPEHLKDLAGALAKNKSALNQKLSKLSKAGMMDASSLKERAVGNRRSNAGLAQFLKEHAQRMSVEQVVEGWCGRGGVDRGRGDAAMTWTDGTSEKGARFKEKQLAPSAINGLNDSQLLGLSAAAPDVVKSLTGHGALGHASKGGGSAHTQTILPRHKGAVKRYFDRNEEKHGTNEK